MKSLTLTSFALTFALASFGTALAQKDQIVWAKDWDEAKKEAKARNVPILWLLSQDG